MAELTTNPTTGTKLQVASMRTDDPSCDTNLRDATAASQAHRLRRRLAVWPTRELVQRQGAGRLAGEHENE
jgi:hypothetical protein